MSLFRQDLTGKRFGHLTVMKWNGGGKWQCLCDCGKKTIAPTGMLNFGKRTTCGCRGQYQMVGKKFGRLTVIKKSRTQPGGAIYWNCKCDCGNTIKAKTSLLNNGAVKSCGCLAKDSLIGLNNYQAKRTIAKYGKYVSSKDPIYVRSANIMGRSRKFGIPNDFDSTLDLVMYLKDISQERCPVFGKKLVSGVGQSHQWSPSVDRIIPSKGYVRGNLQVISLFANNIKQDATPKQLKQFALWVKGNKNG